MDQSSKSTTRSRAVLKAKDNSKRPKIDVSTEKISPRKNREASKSETTQKKIDRKNPNDILTHEYSLRGSKSKKGKKGDSSASNSKTELPRKRKACYLSMEVKDQNPSSSVSSHDQLALKDKDFESEGFKLQRQSSPSKANSEISPHIKRNLGSSPTKSHSDNTEVKETLPIKASEKISAEEFSTTSVLNSKEDDSTEDSDSTPDDTEELDESEDSSTNFDEIHENSIYKSNNSIFNQENPYLLTSRGISEVISVLKSDKGTEVQLVTLQNLAECLSVASEDMMSSCSGKRALITALVEIIKKTPSQHVSNFINELGNVDIMENVLLACRCLCNLMESFPPSTEIIVRSGAISIMIDQLNDIQFIELAEQIILILKIVSQDFAFAIIRDNGLKALLSYIDFFSTQVQRNVVTAVANCCKNLDMSYFETVLGVLPLIQNVLNISDTIVIKQVCMIFTNIVKSYSTSHIKLELIFNEDILEAILVLLRPSINSSLEKPSYLNLMSLLNKLTKSSFKISTLLLNKQITEILYHNIFGELPSGSGSSFVSKTSDLIETTLELSSNLLPELAIDDKGFDNSYSIDSEQVLNFGSIMAPAATKLFKVSNSVKTKTHCLNLLHKLVIFSCKDSLKDILSNMAIGSFLAGIIASQEHHLFVLRALQLVDTLISKLPKAYFSIFSREGVLENLSSISKQKPLKPGKVSKSKKHIDGEFSEVSNMKLTHDLEKLHRKINQQFSEYSKFHSTELPNFETSGGYFVVPLAKAIHSKFLAFNPTEYKIHQNVMGKLSRLARDLTIERFNSRSQSLCEDALSLLRDFLFTDDLTTYELSSSKIIKNLYYFLDSSSDSVSHSSRMEMFHNQFFRSEKGLVSLKNLIYHLQYWIDNLEAHKITFTEKENISMRYIIQTKKILLLGESKTSTHSPHVIEMQLLAPMKLLTDHVTKFFLINNLLSESYDHNQHDVLFKYKDIKLDSNVTLFKALVHSGICAEKLNNSPITITYHIIPKGEPWFVNPILDKIDERPEELNYVFHLLHTFHNLIQREESQMISYHFKQTLPPELFINLKLTSKLTNQLENPLIVACDSLPNWCSTLVYNFPFLFPVATRIQCLQSFSFGSDRLISKFNDSSIGRQQELPVTLGRMSKCKLRVSRQNLLKSAVKIFETYSANRAILEIQFYDEVGSGQGPTLEFFSCVFQEFCRNDIGLWRDQVIATSTRFVNTAHGLFPQPRRAADLEDEDGKKIIHYFKTLGWMTAKALIDSRVVDIPLNEAFIELLFSKYLGHSNREDSLRQISLVDPSLSKSLHYIWDISKNNPHQLKEMEVSFILPGYDIELKENGANSFVNESNVDCFLDAVFDFTIGKGVHYALNAFEQGFNCVFPLQELSFFTVRELASMLGNSHEDWSFEAISNSLKAEHGFSLYSLSIIWLIQILTELDCDQKCLFLQFITGSRKLPVGGFHGLNPNLTVVRKQCESTSKPDDYLPSVNTCFNYLKLPEYSSKEIMKERLLTAIHEGKCSFHLS